MSGKDFFEGEIFGNLVDDVFFHNGILFLI